MARLRLILPLALFLTLAFYQLDLPGLHYDEAFEAVPAVQLLANRPVSPFRGSALTLFGRQFPLTTQDYIGALNTYAALPFLAVGGVSVASLRSYAIVVGLVSLLLVYGFTTDLARDRRAGPVAAALLSVNPTFVFWSRQGVFVTAVGAAIGVGAAWSWLAWHRRRRYRWAALGAFLFGLGVYAKLLFVWLIGAFMVLFLVERIVKGRGQVFGGFSARQLLGLLIAFGAGCWPLIVYNLQTGGTLKSIAQNAATSYYGVDNAAVLPNLAARLEQLVTLLNGGHLWYLGSVHANNVAPALFGLALAASVWLAVTDKTTAPLIPFLVIGLVTVESIVTVSALWITHFALIMVWPAIALAVTGVELARRFAGRPGVLPTLWLALALLLATEGYTTWQYHRALTVSGGLGSHSDAVYDLAAWLNQRPAGPVVAMDWGLAAPVTFLSGGSITPIELFGYDWDAPGRFEARIAPYLTPRQAVFLWRAPDEIIFDRSGDFEARYRPLKLEETILAAFYERSGRPVLGVTELVPQGSAENPP
ncbi:MAG: hypothetical protein ACE5G8_04610 [Anaerolineae bacterium]